MNTDQDTKIGNICFGWFLGFGFTVIWSAIKQTQRSRNPRRCVFIWMVWAELVANLGIALIAYLLLEGVIKITLGLLIFGLSLWVIEVQFLLQIIINRLAIVMPDQRQAARLKWSIAGIMTVINIAVFCIWIPAQLQVSPLYIHINEIWDRISKILILLIDAALNYYFVRVVKERLVDQGLTKYDALVRFNIKIMLISIAMDVLIIGLMSLTNPIVYISFQAIAYLVKLKIEMSMADLIAKVAQIKAHISTAPGMIDSKENHNFGVALTTVQSQPSVWQRRSQHEPELGLVVNKSTDVTVESGEVETSSTSGDEAPLRTMWVSGNSSKIVLRN